MKRSLRTIKVARYHLAWSIGFGTISITLFVGSLCLLLSLQIAAGIVLAILGFCFGFIACRLIGDACRLFNISQMEKNFEADALNRKQYNN